MKPLLYFCLFAGAAPLAVALPSAGAIVERARSTIATESVLGDLVTLKLEGRVLSSRPGQPDAHLRIILRRPNSYRSTIRTEGLAEHTIIQGGRGCMIRSNPELGESGMRSLTQEEVERISITMNDWFDPFRPKASKGDQVHYLGIEDKRGRRCHHLRYVYGGAITIDRYFAVDDGSLVSSVNDLGVERVAVGRQSAGGMIFPEKVEYYENNEKLHTVVFTRIAVNRPLPAGVFAIPK